MNNKIFNNMKKMRYIVICSLLMISFVSCNQKELNHNGKKEVAEPVSDVPLTKIEFAETEHDFGTIKQGEKVNHVFVFKNTGENPLMVTQVQPSCGCTVPEWTKEPVAPGAEGKVEVMFNSEGRSGAQHKSVTVVSNTSPRANTLTFTVEIE